MGSSITVIHRYDNFLARLKRGPIPISDSLSGLDGDTRCTGRYFEVSRTVVRLEFLGYRQRGNLLVPYLREVYSCGHSYESSVGSFCWTRPRKWTACMECSDAIPPIPDAEGRS